MTLPPQPGAHRKKDRYLWAKAVVFVCGFFIMSVAFAMAIEDDETYGASTDPPFMYESSLPPDIYDEPTEEDSTEAPVLPQVPARAVTVPNPVMERRPVPPPTPTPRETTPAPKKTVQPPPPPPKPTPTPTEGCDPNYEPKIDYCVPISIDDINCDEVEGPVNVIGEDIHGLDADNDGVGCEV